MKKLPNIFFSGFAGSGKTHCCEFLKEKYLYKQAKIATPVYVICQKYLGMEYKNRHLLQYCGSEIGRDKIGKDIWINRFCDDTWIADQTSRYYFGEPLKFVCDDVRFKNEADVLKKENWVGIWLDVPEKIRLQRLKNRDGDAQEEHLNHVSETSMKEFKDNLIQLDASGTIDQTFERLEETLEYIKKEHNNEKNN